MTWAIYATPDRLGRPVYQVSEGGMLRAKVFTRRTDAESYLALLQEAAA